MRGYITPVVEGDDTVNRVPVERPVAVFRADDGSYRVLVETDSDRVELDVRDVTVSRKKDAAPIEIVPERDAITVHNRANKNPVTVEIGPRETTLERGQRERVTQDCIVQAGFNTRLRLTVETEDKRGQTLSVDELQEKLGIDEGESIVSGVDPAAYAKSLAENLRKASDEGANECLKFATEAENLIESQSLDDPDYETTREAVERFRADLESRVNQSSLRSVDVTEDEEWQERIDRIAHRIETLYARTKP